MRIIAFRTLRAFFSQPNYRDSEISIRSWYHDVKNADWRNSNDLKQQFKHANIVGNSRVIFNIKGNKYRLVADIDYEFQLVFIRFIGTHQEYDEIDPKMI